MRIDKKIHGLLSCTLPKKKKNKTQKQIGQSPANLFVAFIPFFYVTWAKLKIKTCEDKTYKQKPH